MQIIENGIRKPICIIFATSGFIFKPGMLTIKAGIAKVALSLIDIPKSFVITFDIILLFKL